MKTFGEFIFICEKLNKTHDEDSQSKLWNYFIANSDNQKVRDLILNKDYKGAEEEIKKEVNKAKSDASHPLNFNNAGDEEFSKKEGRQSGDEKTYNDFLDDSVSGLLALSKQNKLRSAVERGLPSRVTGSSAAELSKKFKGAGGVDKTPKGDIEIYDPNNPKDRRGISMKKGVGAQLASAEGGELKGMFKVAARDYVRRFHSDKSKEERRSIEKEIMNDAERLSAIGRLQKTAGEAPDVNKQKQSLKDVSQGISDKLLDKYPQFERLLSQVATSGKGKFASDSGTAGVVLTGKSKNKEASAKPSEQQGSSKPRLALPKGSGRPGNLKIDYRPREEKSKQSSFIDFSKQASMAQKALTNAEREQADASVIKYPDGTPVPRKNRYYLQNNPNAAQQHAARQQAAAQAVQQAQTTIADIQTKAAQAIEKSKPQTEAPRPQPQQPQRTEPVDTKPQQPVEKTPEQPILQLQPKTSEQKKSKRERTEAERSDMRKRMDNAGKAQGFPEYA
jgi:hypothetical protein